MTADTRHETKAEMERRLEESWSQIITLVDSLPDSEIEVPGVVGEWSVKDLLGHMAFWAQKAAGDLRLLSEGRADQIETPGGEQALNEWNEREYRRRKEMSPADVRAEWVASFEDARSVLQATPEELLWQEVKGWPQAVRFREDTYVHYQEHGEHIRNWIRQTETSEA